MAFSTLAEQAAASCTTIEEVGSTGVGALTLAFIIFLVSTCVFAFKGKDAKLKDISYLSIYICGFAAISYFAMLSGQGWTVISGCRQFFYVRYMEWAISMPMIIILLGLIAGAEWVTILGAIGAQTIQNFAMYIGAISVLSEVKWMWFLITLAGLAGVLLHLSRVFKAAADIKGGAAAELFTKVCWISCILFACYPVVWLFSEGFGSFSVSFEVTIYALLDVLAKVLVCFLVLGGIDALSAEPADEEDKEMA